jgi:hypothetical protein
MAVAMGITHVQVKAIPDELELNTQVASVVIADCYGWRMRSRSILDFGWKP